MNPAQAIGEWRTPREAVAGMLRGGWSQAAFERFGTRNLLASAEHEGVLPLLGWRLRDSREVAPEFRDAMTRPAREAAARAMARAGELQQLRACLGEAGLRVLLLKGAAFALWLYPEPYLRVSGDFDLLFASREDSETAARVLAARGYELAFRPGSMSYEMSSRRMHDGVLRAELDLHCRLADIELYAGCFGFDELWAASMALPGVDGGLRGLGEGHALVHACIHRAVDMALGRPDRLKWSYDIHLMLARLDEAGWDAFIALVRGKGLAGVCLRSFEDACECFATPVPAMALARLRGIADGEAIDRHRIDDWRYVQWRSFLALPGLGRRLRWLWQRVLPTRSHLQEMHGRDASLPVLVLRRLRRGVARWLGRE